MERKLLMLVALGMYCSLSFSQGVTKSATGESSVLFKGINIGIDVGKTDFTFGANNLQSSIGSNGKFIYGGYLKGENKEGLSTIFSKGDAVPMGAVNGFAGYSFSNATSRVNELLKGVILLDQEKYTKRFLLDFKTHIYYSTNFYCKDSTQQSLKKSVLDKLKTMDFIEEIGKLFDSVAGDVPDVVLAKKNLKREYESLKKDYDTTIVAFETKLTKVENEYERKNYWQLMVFGFGSYSSTQFKRYNGLDPVNYGDSFADVNSRGDKLGVGLNFQFANVTFGFSYAEVTTNNFDALSKKTFTYKKTNEMGNQSLVETKEITAYTGNYGSLSVEELAMDVVVSLSLDKKHKNHLLVNPYIRVNSSLNKTLLPTTTNLGAGLYFFQQTGKFLGGFYVELPDANNNYERMKAEAERKFRPARQRLTLGLVGKLSLSTLLGII